MGDGGMVTLATAYPSTGMKCQRSMPQRNAISPQRGPSLINLLADGVFIHLDHYHNRSRTIFATTGDMANAVRIQVCT